MIRVLCLVVTTIFFLVSNAYAGFMDSITGEVLPHSSSIDNNVIVKGLKEALATGTENAVKAVAKSDGYLGNQSIKILLPEKIQNIANVVGELGYQAEVDAVIKSMNRAAESAAPKAANVLGDAIRQMSVDDAKGILNGGNTAATKYFEKTARKKLFDAFKPSIKKSMEQVGTVKSYENMIGKYADNPLMSIVGTPSVDLDSYVTNKALDGLFVMVGNEEKKIRTNPAAQTTDILKKVFGGK